MSVDKADLEQMKRQRRQLLLVQAVGGKLTAAAIENKAIGAVPVFDHIEALVDLASQCLGFQKFAQKDGFDRAPQFKKRLVGRVLVPCLRAIEFLLVGILEPWHQLKAEGVTESESHLAVY